MLQLFLSLAPGIGLLLVDSTSLRPKLSSPKLSSPSVATTGSTSTSGTWGTSTLYSKEHSPVSLPVYVQIIILHLLAVLLALFFYFLRQFVVAKLNQRSVVIPNLRMTHRRKRKSSGSKTNFTKSALKQRLKDAQATGNGKQPIAKAP